MTTAAAPLTFAPPAIPTTTTTTCAPAIEPANQPTTFMSKAAAAAPSGDPATAPDAQQNSGDNNNNNSSSSLSISTSTANDSSNAAIAARSLKKTMSTESMVESNAGLSSSSCGGGTPSASGSKQRKYERKTKRFIWPDELHRLFIAAIFDVGLKNASPKALLGLMGAAGPDTGLTTEHLKSHLQKYRLNYERSRAEFLEFYDYSAKKNLKRRRKHGNKPGEPNTMFVFPIVHKKQRGESDESDSDGEGGGSSAAAATGGGAGGPDDAMSDSTLEHVTPRGSTSSAAGATLERAGSFTSMMHNPKDAMSAAAYTQRTQQLQMMGSGANASDRTSFSSAMAPAQAMQAAAAYAVANQQRKTSLHIPCSNGSSNTSSNPAAVAAMNNRAMAAAAAAAAAYRYPLGLPLGGPGGAAGVNGALGDLSDPQWNILSSLMSPHIVGMNGQAGTLPQTSEGLGGADQQQFQLQDEANDLQLQMHLAMQAQMNLHRQMLTRKVEVSQHLANNQQQQQQLGSDAAGANSSFNAAWGNAQHQQQQQFYQQQQEQQQRAARQALATSSHHPQQMQMALAAGMSQQQQQQQQQTPRPSLAPRASSNVMTSVPMGGSATMGMSSTQGMGSSSNNSNANARAPIPFAVGPSIDVSNMLMTDVGGFDKSASGASAASTAVEDDSLELYRWDRIDLNVELDDDDLFGFLKS